MVVAVRHASHSTVDRSQSGGNHLITSITYMLVLALADVFGSVPINPQSGSPRSDGVNLAEILTTGSWEYRSYLGTPAHPIGIEGLTLTFCGCGHVREVISDDTGMYEAYGSWAVERTDDGDVLILPDVFRYHGRLSIKYLEKEKAIDLWIGAPEQ